MKITTRDATVLQVLGIIVIVALTVVTMFYPEVLGNEHSLKSIKEKEATITSLNGELKSTERNVQDSKSNLERVKSDAESIGQEADRLKIGIQNTNFKLHMPSILISLEQKANEYDLKLLMEYDKIETIDAADSVPVDGEESSTDLGMTEGEQPAESETEAEQAKDEEKLVQSSTDTSLPEEEKNDSESKKETEINNVVKSGEADAANVKKEDGTAVPVAATDGTNPEEVDMSAALKNIPSIPGISVTLIPVRVSGTYANVRSFIKYLDEVDFIEHNYVDLHSSGETVSGIIVFNVFHAEEGGSY